MSAPQSKLSSRRWSERFLSGPGGSPSRISESLSPNASHGESTDWQGHTESSKYLGHSGSPSRRLTTLPEVWDAMMEEEPEHPEDIEHAFDSESRVQRRIPHVQIQGGNVWREYNTHAKALENDLQNFHDAVQGLGSSLDIAHSARRTRDCLSLVSWFFQENGRNLFPLAVKSIDVPRVVEDLYMTEAKSSPRWPPAAASSIAPVPDPKIGSLHKQLMELAQNIERLRGALEQFSEFNNLGKRPLKWFESDLQYWSSCLEQYDGQYDTHEVKVFIHDLSSELGKRFMEVSQYIAEYIAHVPNVRLLQKHAMSNLHTLATIATFFSAVTATTIQYSIGIADTRLLSRIVLGLWFTSLVFSIASALNSSIAIMWRSAAYAPEMRIPFWLWIWIRQCPTIFLLVSVVTFLAGLVCFAASTQPRVTWIIVLVFVGISSFSLAALLFLLAADKWSSSVLREQKLQEPILTRILGEKTGNVLPTHIEHGASWSIGQLSRAAALFAFITPYLDRSWPGQPEEPKTMAGVAHTPTPPHPEPVPPVPPVHRNTPSRSSSTLPPMQQLWRRTIRKVILISRATQAHAEWGMQESDSMTTLESQVRNIAVTNRTIQHEAGPETSDMQFHPNGTSLAICGKRLSMEWEIGSSTGLHQYNELRHYVGQARQVIWLTSGNYLLTRTNRAVHVWEMFPEIRRTKMITRYESSSLILSIPNMKGNLPRFLSVEGNAMNKLCLIDINGDEHMTHDFDDVSIQHADVVPEGSCVLLAVEVTEGQQGARPVKASPTRKLMVFNVEHRNIEHEVPLWHKVQYVTISGSGQMAIVTYQNYPPPQLWLLQRTKEGIRLRLDRQLCARERSSIMAYDPTQSIRFSGSGQFLHRDRFIMCATTEGKIHFWRRDRFDPVHVLSDLTAEKDKPLQIACSRASEDFMFATRSQDGKIRIWNTRDKMGVTAENALGLLNHNPTQPLTLSDSPLIGQLPELSEGPEVESGTLNDEQQSA